MIFAHMFRTSIFNYGIKKNISEYANGFLAWFFSPVMLMGVLKMVIVEVSFIIP